MLISQLKCDLLCRLSACFDLRALCRRRFCEGDVALVLSKKEKVISAHKQEKLITLKGRTRRRQRLALTERLKARAWTSGDLDAPQKKGEGRVCNGSSWRPDRLTWRRWNNSNNNNNTKKESKQEAPKSRRVLKLNHCISCIPKEERGSRSINISAFTFITGRVSRHTLG